MDAMRESWTDDRLDDLNGKVDAFRLETRTEFAAVRGEMKEGFDKVDARFERVDARFDKIDARFDKIDARFEKMDERFQVMDTKFVAMYRMMFGFCAGTLIAVLGLLGTQL